MKRDWQAIAGIIAAVYLISWLAVVVCLSYSDPQGRETRRETAREMRKLHPKKVSYEQWRPAMRLWTDAGDRNYSAFMPETACRKLYESLRHPWKAKARHYGELAIGLGCLCSVIGGAIWAGMRLEER